MLLSNKALAAGQPVTRNAASFSRNTLSLTGPRSIVIKLTSSLAVSAFPVGLQSRTGCPISTVIGALCKATASRKTVWTAAALPSDGVSQGQPASDRLQAVLDALDELNSKDPRTVEVEGQQVPYELSYSRWLSAWVHALCGDAGRQPSEELRIAARGQHVQRWKLPRNDYPEGRAGYLAWREELKRRHAATTAAAMRGAGYGEDSCRRVEQLILKRALREAEGQILEDALCLVFLERQFAEFVPMLAHAPQQAAGAGDAATGEAEAAAAAAQADAEAKIIDILRKSWGKMGELGRAAALRLPLGPREAELVGRALAQ